jgi:hypothetical protein
MRYGGTVSNITPRTSEQRVIAVADHLVLAAAPVDANGHWTLETDAHATWIIAQSRQLAVAAVAAEPTANMHLKLPELVDIDLEQGGTESGVTLWIDPIELAGFPDHLIWSLFAQPDRVVDLHVAELNLPPGECVTIPVQRGRYRLSGGTIAIRPGFGPDALQLKSVTDVATGKLTDGDNGLVVLDIRIPARYLLHFHQVSSTNGAMTIELFGK